MNLLLIYIQFIFKTGLIKKNFKLFLAGIVFFIQSWKKNI